MLELAGLIDLRPCALFIRLNAALAVNVPTFCKAAPILYGALCNLQLLINTLRNPQSPNLL